MPAQKPVRACMCYPRTFAELKALAQANGWKTVAEITTSVGCGGGCGLCRPYLAKMLETGETAFAVLQSPERGYGFRFSVKSRLLYLEATGFTENRAHYRERRQDSGREHCTERNLPINHAGD